MKNINEHSKTIHPCEEAKRSFAMEGGAKFESYFWASGDDVRYAMNALSQLSGEDLQEIEVIFKERLMLFETREVV